jgi:pyruvate dehydrogenase E1 component
VILAKTIKGYGLGEAGEGRNVTHQQKKLNEQELRHFSSRFGIPIPDAARSRTRPFYRPDEESEEMLSERTAASPGGLSAGAQCVGAHLPPPKKPDVHRVHRKARVTARWPPPWPWSTLLAKLLADKKIGRYIVPIVPDEARTFGMESLFRKIGIYSHVGQNYEPVDRSSLLYYKEATDGQILEEGITEAGSMALVYRRRHRLFHLRHQHGALFFLLLHVRIPTHRRHDLGRR